MMNFTFKKSLKKYGANIMSECAYDNHHSDNYRVEIFDFATNLLYNNKENDIANYIVYYTKARSYKVVSYSRPYKSEPYIVNFELNLDELPEGASINFLQEKINGYENQKDV